MVADILMIILRMMAKLLLIVTVLGEGVGVGVLDIGAGAVLSVLHVYRFNTFQSSRRATCMAVRRQSFRFPDGMMPCRW